MGGDPGYFLLKVGVGPAVLWNLNFRMIANGTEKAQWGIVDPGGSPLPVYNALAAMPK